MNPTRSAKRIVTVFVRATSMVARGVHVRDDLLDDLRGVVALEPPADALLLAHVLVETRPLDRDRREVGERRQQIEVRAP